MAIKWEALKKGDKVRVIAPSAQTTESWDELEKSCDYLRSLGLVPTYSEKIFIDLLDSYYNFANTDDARYEDFVDALQSDAQAIWCFRGGYGCDRVIARLIENKISPQNGIKIFLGFSDITNLHTYITQQWDWSTLHTSCLKQFPLQQISEQDEQNTLDILFGRSKEVSVLVLPLNEAALNANVIHGEIIGGNLTTLQCALGTPWEITTTGKILLMEDIGEAAYRIARMLFQFLNNGYLAKTSAVLLGDFISEQSIDDVISEFATVCPVPVLRIAGVGHSSENYPLPLHTPARIEVSENSQLFAETGIVTP